MKYLNYGTIFYDLDEHRHAIRVEVSLPTAQENGDFASLLKFSGFGQSFEKYQFGVSPAQAFLLAIHKANFLILNSDPYKAGILRYTFQDGKDEPLQPQFIGVQTDEWGF